MLKRRGEEERKKEGVLLNWMYFQNISNGIWNGNVAYDFDELNIYQDFEDTIFDLRGAAYRRWAWLFEGATHLILFFALPTIPLWNHSETASDQNNSFLLVEAAVKSKWFKRIPIIVIISGIDLYDEERKKEVKSCLNLRDGEVETILEAHATKERHIPYILCNLMCKQEALNAYRAIKHFEKKENPKTIRKIAERDHFTLYEAKMVWDAEKHKEFPKDFRENVFCLLLCTNRMG